MEREDIERRIAWMKDEIEYKLHEISEFQEEIDELECVIEEEDKKLTAELSAFMKSKENAAINRELYGCYSCETQDNTFKNEKGDIYCESCADMYHQESRTLPTPEEKKWRQSLME